MCGAAAGAACPGPHQTASTLGGGGWRAWIGRADLAGQPGGEPRCRLQRDGVAAQVPDGGRMARAAALVGFDCTLRPVHAQGGGVRTGRARRRLQRRAPLARRGAVAPRRRRVEVAKVPRLRCGPGWGTANAWHDAGPSSTLREKAHSLQPTSRWGNYLLGSVVCLLVSPEHWHVTAGHQPWPVLNTKPLGWKTVHTTAAQPEPVRLTTGSTG
jgi:hypothetical protein